MSCSAWQNDSSTRPSAQLVWPVLLVSAAVLAFEISLLRMLVVASWHHFASLVISIALLGFGASGTALFMLRHWILKHASAVLLVLLLATGLSMPIGAQVAQHVPVEARFLPSLFWPQLGSWVLYWLVLTIPFLLGASVIGLALMLARDRQSSVYGANLLGSGMGAILSALVMCIVAPHWLPLICAIPALFAAMALRAISTSVRLAALVISIVTLGIFLWFDPPQIRPDPYKDSAYVQRLEQQHSVERLSVAYSPRSMVEIYRGDVFHNLPFLSVGATPPPLDVILIDGHLAGSVLRIRGVNQAGVVDRTLMAFPYSLTPPDPQVLLLGELGGTNIWLAVRQGATRIDVVQPDGMVSAAVRRRAEVDYGNVLSQPGVNVVTAEPRHFVNHDPRHYDLIQLVTLEGLATGSGMGGLGQDHLVSVQGITACLRRLSPEGLLSVCRGIQTPPRDNVKLLATFVTALDRLGIREPQRHILIVRDYLAVCTIVKKSPWKAKQLEHFKRQYGERELTPVWFPGIKPEVLNQPDELAAPPDGVGDWYYYAATRLFSPEADQFIDQWHFDIRPPTDDRPFFRDFCKLRSIGVFKQAFGDLWLTRSELAFLFVLGAMVIVALVGAASAVLPLLLLRKRRPHRGKASTAAYFTAIGLAYLMLEMTMLSRLTHLIGDPVRAATVTISAFLVISGLGSLVAQRARRNRLVLPCVMVALLGVGIFELSMLDFLTVVAGSLVPLLRSAVAVVMIAPLAILMGFPMPMALARLDQAEPSLIPWAWGINGFASVFAAPLATVIGMTWGFTIAGMVALLSYAAAAIFFLKLPR